MGEMFKVNMRRVKNLSCSGFLNNRERVDAASDQKWEAILVVVAVLYFWEIPACEAPQNWQKL